MDRSREALEGKRSLAEQLGLHPPTLSYLRDMWEDLREDGIGDKPKPFRSPLQWARDLCPHDEEKVMDIAGKVSNDLGTIIDTLTRK